MADETVPIRSDDPEMLRAIKDAKASVKVFFDALRSPTQTPKHFLVKVAVETGDEVEHIWLADLRFDPTPTGVIANQPKRKDLSFMQRVPIDFESLTDWMFVDDGNLVGGFTTRLLRERMSPEARKRLDDESPFRFE